MCLENICKPGRVEASSMLPWQPESPAQWWRVPLSLLYHHGIIQLIVVTVTQWFLLTQIEVTAGWFRMFIIYVISGTMALLVSRTPKTSPKENLYLFKHEVFDVFKHHTLIVSTVFKVYKAISYKLLEKITRSVKISCISTHLTVKLLTFNKFIEYNYYLQSE